MAERLQKILSAAGIASRRTAETLIERRLIKAVGRKQVVGRPFMYATTREFLERFGLGDLSDLPKVEELSDALGFELPGGLAELTQTTSPLPFETEASPEERSEPESPDEQPVALITEEEEQEKVH